MTGSNDAWNPDCNPFRLGADYFWIGTHGLVQRWNGDALIYDYRAIPFLAAGI